MFARNLIMSAVMQAAPQATYLSVAHATSPYVTIYKRAGDTFTKLPDPATLPAGAGNSVALS